MGTKKQWTGKETPAIVLQGLKGDYSVSALCNDHGITQGMYCKWRDQLLNDGAKLFDRGRVDLMRANAWNTRIASSKKPSAN